MFRSSVLARPRIRAFPALPALITFNRPANSASKGFKAYKNKYEPCVHNSMNSGVRRLADPFDNP
jgi:hypothetical protein